MILSSFAKRAEKFTIDNSPTILTTIAVLGSVSTAVLAGKASFRAADILAEEELKQSMTPRERVNCVWPEYVPAAVCGVLTVSAIVGANRISNRRAAALAAAYTLSEKAYSEYKEKVINKLGEKAHQQVRDEIAQDHVTANPNTSVIVSENEILCKDLASGRYFKSTMETIKKAQNDLNYQILGDMYASLTDFYNRVGLEPTAYSDEVGWSVDQKLEIEFSTAMTEEGKPCLVISFVWEPIRNFYKFH